MLNLKSRKVKNRGNNNNGLVVTQKGSYSNINVRQNTILKDRNNCVRLPDGSLWKVGSAGILPLQGWRKNLNNCGTETIVVYKDNHSKGVSKSTCYSKRIRSGMQEKKVYDSKLKKYVKKKKISSYSEYLKKRCRNYENVDFKYYNDNFYTPPNPNLDQVVNAEDISVYEYNRILRSQIFHDDFLNQTSNADIVSNYATFVSGKDNIGYALKGGLMTSNYRQSSYFTTPQVKSVSFWVKDFNTDGVANNDGWDILFDGRTSTSSDGPLLRCNQRGKLEIFNGSIVKLYLDGIEQTLTNYGSNNFDIGTGGLETNELIGWHHIYFESAVDFKGLSMLSDYADSDAKYSSQATIDEVRLFGKHLPQLDITLLYEQPQLSYSIPKSIAPMYNNKTILFQNQIMTLPNSLENFTIRVYVTFKPNFWSYNGAIKNFGIFTLASETFNRFDSNLSNNPGYINLFIDPVTSYGGGHTTNNLKMYWGSAGSTNGHSITGSYASGNNEDSNRVNEFHDFSNLIDQRNEQFLFELSYDSYYDSYGTFTCTRMSDGEYFEYSPTNKAFQTYTEVEPVSPTTRDITHVRVGTCYGDGGVVLDNDDYFTVDDAYIYDGETLAVPGPQIPSNTFRGNCNECKEPVIHKRNNKNFYKQGAVSSGSRLDKLKFDTIMDSQKNTSDPNCPCAESKYFAGKPRFTGHVSGLPCKSFPNRINGIRHCAVPRSEPTGPELEIYLNGMTVNLINNQGTIANERNDFGNIVDGNNTTFSYLTTAGTGANHLPLSINITPSSPLSGNFLTGFVISSEISSFGNIDLEFIKLANGVTPQSMELIDVENDSGIIKSIGVSNVHNPATWHIKNHTPSNTITIRIKPMMMHQNSKIKIRFQVNSGTGSQLWPIKEIKALVRN